MAHWRHAPQADAQHLPPPHAESGLPFGVWWAIAESVAAVALLLSLRLFRLI